MSQRPPCRHDAGCSRCCNAIMCAKLSLMLACSSCLIHALVKLCKGPLRHPACSVPAQCPLQHPAYAPELVMQLGSVELCACIWVSPGHSTCNRCCLLPIDCSALPASFLLPLAASYLHNWQDSSCTSSGFFLRSQTTCLLMRAAALHSTGELEWELTSHKVLHGQGGGQAVLST